jgi:hypothetical protein
MGLEGGTVHLGHKADLLRLGLPNGPAAPRLVAQL